MTTRINQKNRIISLILSVVLICITFLWVQNSKVVEAVDHLILMEYLHPVYWGWFRDRAVDADSDADGTNDVTIYPISKMCLKDITALDYSLFLKDTERDRKRRLIYFMDGTGFDVNKSIYGNVNIDSWSVIDGVHTELSSVKYQEKPINLEFPGIFSNYTGYSSFLLISES